MFLKNKNIIFKIRRSKVTDFAALTSSIVKSKTLYWQAFSYAGDSIHEAFFHRGSVALESTLLRMH